MNLFNMFIEGVVTALLAVFVFYVIPRLYKSGKQKKKEHIENKKVYYGVFRMIGLFFLALMSGETLLMLLLGDKVEGSIALLLLLGATIVFMILYLWLYKRHYYKLINKQQEQ